MLAIVTTIYPLEYFASRIAGDLADVVNLVSPGVEAHDFSPSPNDIKKLDAADLIFYNGRGLEPWIDRALENIPSNGRVVIEATAILRDRSESNTSRVDPHIWLDPTKAKQQVTLLRDGMIEVNPENGDIYNAEWGYVSYEELRKVATPQGVEVDRDLYWKTRPAGEVEKIVEACQYRLEGHNYHRPGSRVV